MLWLVYPASKAIVQFTEIVFRLSVDCDHNTLCYFLLHYIIFPVIIAPSLLVLSIYINVYIITIHIIPDTFIYIELAVSATTVFLRGCGHVLNTHSLFWTRFCVNN